MIEFIVLNINFLIYSGQVKFIMKKSFLTLITFLIIGGLLIVWSVDAMTYTVNANKTLIAIPNDDYVWITIDWENDGNIINFSPTSTGCDKRGLLTDTDFIVCEKMYNDNGPHTVKITNNNPSYLFDNIRLKNASISDISDFEGFKRVTNLYLDYNRNISLDETKIKSISLLSNLSLSNNWLETFPLNLGNLHSNPDIKNINFTNNSLDTIPDNIWNNRDTYIIRLSNSISYQSKSNLNHIINLSNNQIKFVWITKIDNHDSLDYETSSYRFYDNTNSYKFERFGFSQGNGTNLTYDYQIFSENNQSDIKTSKENHNSTTATISTPLKPWAYTFKVCLHNSTEYCDTINFTVNHDEEIAIMTPVSELYGYLNIQWKRWRTWNYPKELLNWYEYIISKVWWSSTWWFVSHESLNNWNSCSPYHDCKENFDMKNIIKTERSDNPNGKYILTVYLIDNEWNRAQKRNYWRTYFI